MDLSGVLDILQKAPSLWPLASLRPQGPLRLTLGVGDAARAALLALLARHYPGPMLVLVPQSDRAEALAEELATWLGEPERVLLFPERDPLPFERLVPDPEAVRDRLRALAALNGEGRPLVVASAVAAAQHTLSPNELAAASKTLRPGDPLTPDVFLAELSALGYTLEPLVERPGQASRRGGIIDLFPATAHLPVRIELVGRQLESLRLFDPISQRSLQTVETVKVGPARELILRPGPESRDVPAKAQALLARLDFSLCPPEVRERFREEISLLAQGIGFPADHFYVPFLASSTLLEHLPEGALAVIAEEAEAASAVEEAQRQAAASRTEMEGRGEIPQGLPLPLTPWPNIRTALEERPQLLRLSPWATGEEPGSLRLPFGPAEAYGGQLHRLVEELIPQARAGRRIVIVSQQAPRLAELLEERDMAVPVRESLLEAPSGLALVRGSLPAGWRLTDDGADLTLLTDSEMFGFAKQRRAVPRRAISREAFLAELSPGDYVVHVDHGIARFAGLVTMSVDGHQREYLELHYAEGDKLFVPTDQLDRVSRYIGPSDHEPHLTRLGSGDWQRAKQRVRRAVRDLARELLELYAAREVISGYAFSPDTPWQAELEVSFPYMETPDQLAAIADVKRDLESPRPMDRLVCGDVGYGKTEVAIRAAFKVVMEGRQVAVLVPTTILAQQHYNTFRERLAAFPVRIEMLSRFRSQAEQRQVVEGLASGAVDIVIGTHRLLQRDIRFKDLGLVIIDEEQRFGVAHKEHLKRMRREVDVLTLSATPIPRTLHMALGGLRDMSTMATPPEERLPIKTYVAEFDRRLIREAILRELERGGQVYFVHNRVHNIQTMAREVREAVPEAVVGIAHGQMPEQELERTMLDFIQRRIDVLVCTTIIESGLDIPNVNTIIINQADRMGLAQLYQLRGRVGRGTHRAYAYLLYDRKAQLTEAARKRLQTIFEAAELGAGFQIALRDLEIRGAGNLLGPEQSGHMAAVGFDLYCRLLAEAVEQMRAAMRGETPPEREGPAITIDLPLSAYLPTSYVPDPNMRLALYQRLSRATEPQQVADIGQEMVDRFGAPPAPARNLLYVVLLRALAGRAGVQSIAAEDGQVVVRLREGLLIPRRSLEARAPRGVHLGRTVLKVDMEDESKAHQGGWRERLRRALEDLAETAPTAAI